MTTGGHPPGQSSDASAESQEREVRRGWSSNPRWKRFIWIGVPLGVLGALGYNHFSYLYSRYGWTEDFVLSFISASMWLTGTVLVIAGLIGGAVRGQSDDVPRAGSTTSSAAKAIGNPPIDGMVSDQSTVLALLMTSGPTPLADLVDASGIGADRAWAALSALLHSGAVRLEDGRYTVPQ